MILPTEIWHLVLSLLPIKDLVKVGRVNKWLYLRVKSMIIEILVLVSFSPIGIEEQIYPSFPLLIKVKPYIRLFPSQIQKCWMHLDTNLNLDLLEKIKSSTNAIWPFGQVQLRRLLMNIDDPQSDWFFPEITLLSPRTNSLYSIKQLFMVELLDFMEIGSRIDLRPLKSCQVLRSLSFQGGSRQLYQETTGIFQGSEFRDLPQTLQILYFYGSWLDKWVLEPMTMLSIISRLQNLTYFMIDLDFQTLGGDIILHLFSNLPKLKSFGRLGGVDKSFWRLCPKAIGSKLKLISVGIPKNPYITPMYRQGVNSSFLDSLGMGILWFAPSIKCLEIWMGYEADQFRLINALSRIKEGPSWDIDGQIKVKQLREINVFEMCDVNSLDDRAWKRLAEIPLSSPIKISVGSQDSFLEGSRKVF